METQLRFAPIIRVSTEQQKKQGESLKTQKSQIIQYVETLKGVVPDHCWQYCGQEHATSKFERHLLEKLLHDSANDLFDAVIVCDASRWSRDNLKSKEGLNILKKNGIRFFVGTTEYDLNNFDDWFRLGITTEMNEYVANQNAKKSIDNRIHRAKNSKIPTAGKLPYARIFDKKTGEWILNEDKANKLRWAAEQYITGKANMYQIAQTLNMTESYVRKLLRERCGDTWTINIKGEQITYNVPRVLPERIIKQVRTRLEFNRRNNRTDVPNKYVLSGFLYCENCHHTLVGQTQYIKGAEFKYYIHPIKPEIQCKAFSSINLERIERAVFLTIFENLMDVPSYERAISESMPDESKIKELHDRISSNKNELRQVLKDQDTLTSKVMAGELTKHTVKRTEEELLEREKRLTEMIESDERQFNSIPDIETVKHEAEKIRKELLAKYRSKDHLFNMSFDEKRDLLYWLFNGRDQNGDPYGIYINKRSKGKDAQIDYFLYGKIQGLRTLKHTDIDYFDDTESNYKTSMLSEHYVCIKTIFARR